MIARKVALGLGWFGIGLGLAELVAADRLCTAFGLPGGARLVRAFGVREIVSGVGILAQRKARRRGKWVWARVAGDALDLAALVFALARRSERRRAAAIALGNVAAVSAADAWCAARLTA